ncbi:MAG: hypothetical protein Q8M09_03765 [Pseudomonadota bacterium]|nr:hypothetical protein [Pseudomonadota bacterium]MDP1903354.1 hypothetical protein [Pseudomonadota bacterium]MDP2352324.1 hypothetical protein [Pseudomonadota bacterium]
MTDKTLKQLVALTIALLLLFQIAGMIAGFFGMAWGAVSALVVATISFFSMRLAKAGGKSSLWFLLPTLLFTLLPLTWTIWNAVTVETGWFERLVALTPFLVGFLLPVMLLLAVHHELRRRTRDTP